MIPFYFENEFCPIYKLGAKGLRGAAQGALVLPFELFILTWTLYRISVVLGLSFGQNSFSIFYQQTN